MASGSEGTFCEVAGLPKLVKYPRTPHLEGSCLQAADGDLRQASFDELAGRYLVVEEKLDGSQAALSFDGRGRLLLQSRGHYLSGGPGERHFAPFKAWAQAHGPAFRAVLGDRYVLFGEWCYAKHTIFYDALPAYFLEHSVFDRSRERFLAAAVRRRLLAPLGMLCSAPILYEGDGLRSLEELLELLAPSRYQTPAWRARLAEQARLAGVAPERALRESDGSGLAEGLYIKTEQGEHVCGRYKWVRAGFRQALASSQGHWRSRPLIANLLAPEVDLYAERLPTTNRERRS
jgi:hypothetical protein